MTVREIFSSMEYGPAPEAAGPALDWIGRHRAFDLFVGGDFVAPAAGRRFPTLNPATGEPLAEVAEADASDVDRAVAAARKAQGPWAALPGTKRAECLYALARHIQKQSRLFAVLESLDNGKTIRETRDIDVPLAVRHFYHHAGWAAVRDGEFPGYRPHGVCGQVIPWNFPLLMLAWKIAPAIAAGNTVVLKPAEQTPLTALLFAEICREVGLPAGVVNIVTGAGAAGAALVAHPGVDKVAFTGSTEVGRAIREATAGSGKSLTLELGGKSPFVVFDDADIDSAVEGVVDSIWFNQGQVCCAGSRLLVQEGMAARMRAKLAVRLGRLRVGDPLDKSNDMGPIVSAEQRERIAGLVAQAVAEGGTLVQAEAALPERGFYFPPTLICDVGPADTVVQEEIFGPVLTMLTFRTPAEAVALANNTRYGLSASVWSENLNLALGIAPQIRAGVVWVNGANMLDAAAGFGGMRESGYGREGGREGMLAYLRRDPAPVAKAKARRKAAPEPVAGLDRTAKLYIGGKQVRPDSGYSMPALDAAGGVAGQVGLGNRKDVRNAVEAAVAARGWAGATAYARSQVLFYLAENLGARREEFAARIAALAGDGAEAAAAEVEAAIERLVVCAAWADKFDGAVHSVPIRGVALAMHEPCGVIGIVCPEAMPLLGLLGLVGPAIAMGNRVVAVPGEGAGLVAADFYQVLETSDVPGGVVNIVTGRRSDLVPTLADHLEVDAVWYFGPAEGVAEVERRSAGNLKRTFFGSAGDLAAFRKDLLEHAVEVKNVWIPYGE
ncbi:MAG: aldehyde dehydrogenase family protein [Amaricoccus sp.]